MTEATTAAEVAARTDRAARMLETLRQRAPAEADMQASAMVMAGLKMLQEVRGTSAVLDTLSRIGPALVAEGPTAPEPRPAPKATPPSDAQPTDLVGSMLAYLRGQPIDQALGQANAAFTASSMFVAETFGVKVAAPPGVPAEAVAVALMEQLRGMHRGAAHERARATVAGAAAYLHEVFGRTYAAALLDGVLDAAKAHGDAMRGGRDTLEMLH